jgi:uncharacterized membrane protein YjfL (UPF0719 family)
MTEYFSATLFQLAVNLVYTVVALIVGVVGFRIVDHILFRQIDFIEEIKRGNIAAAIFASMILLFFALVIGFSLRS